MNNSEIFTLVKNAVMKVTGVDEQGLLMSKTEQCSNARAMLVCELNRLGFTDADISKRIKKQGKV